MGTLLDSSVSNRRRPLPSGICWPPITDSLTDGADIHSLRPMEDMGAPNSLTAQQHNRLRAFTVRRFFPFAHTAPPFTSSIFTRLP